MSKKIDEKSNKYLYQLTYFAKARAVWMFVSFVFAVVVIGQALVITNLATHKEIRLVPYNLALADKEITLKHGVTDPSYLTYLAIADSGLVLNWTPENIKTQYARFLVRTCPNLYSKQKVTMLKEADDFRKEVLTQQFHVLKTSVNPDENTVLLEGVLERWKAGRPVYNSPTSYKLEYQFTGSGLMCVSGLEIASDKKDSNKN